MKILTPDSVGSARVKIFLDDRDITNLCFYAEVPDSPNVEGVGRVKIFIGKKVGNIMTIDVDENHEPKWVEKVGMVRWEPAL